MDDLYIRIVVQQAVNGQVQAAILSDAKSKDIASDLSDMWVVTKETGYPDINGVNSTMKIVTEATNIVYIAATATNY